MIKNGTLYYYIVDNYYCALWHWPKCEHDYVIVPSMNTTPVTKHDCENIVLDFKLIIVTKITHNSISPT
jgi:hypothetical protein